MVKYITLTIRKDKMSGGWNLDDINYSEFPIIQIRFTSITEPPGEDFSLSQLQKTIPIRLFILAHRIANFGIPSIFVESTPNYLILNQSDSILSDNIPSVIVFDLENKFESFTENDDFTPWAETEKFIWSLQNPNHEKNIFFNLSEEFLDDLQQAITLKMYYNFYIFSPLYFTTYILIPSQTNVNELFLKNKKINPFKFDSIFEPIIFKPNPTFVTNCIKIRWVVESDLCCIVNPRYGPKIGSFILFPPFRHPLCINSITTEKTRIFKNSLHANDAKNPTIIPKINSKVIPLPITKGTINRPVSPAIAANSFTVETTIIISAITIDKEHTITFKISHDNESTNTNVNFVLLTKPSISLYHFFYNKSRSQFSQVKQQQQQQQIQTQNQQQAPQYCNFENLNIFDIDEKEILNIIQQHFSEEDSGKSSSVADQQEIAFSFIEDAMPSPYQLITEQVIDKSIKKQISKTIDSILIRFNPNITISELFIKPENDTQSITTFMKRMNLELPRISHSNSKCISFFNFLNYSDFFGFSTSISPPIGRIFDFTGISAFYHLGVPNVFLCQDGVTKEVQADNFLPTWEKEKLMPIYGPKNGFFVVFYETFNTNSTGSSSSSMVNFGLGANSSSFNETNDTFSQMINSDTLSSFMAQFCYAYSHLCFGELKPYPKSSPFIPVKLQPLTKFSTFPSSSASKTQPSMNKETITTKVEIDVDSGSYECELMKRTISNFLSKRPLLQFQEFPVIAFIVGGPSCHFFTIESESRISGFKETDSCPHFHTIYISPEIIINGSNDQIRGLCFEIYGMLRRNQQDPLGNFEFMHKLIKTKSIQNQLTQSIQLQIQQVQSSQNPAQEMQIKQMKNQLKHLIYSNFFYKLFFCFRYQPPFIIKQGPSSNFLMTPEMQVINVNIAWDRAAGISVWTTDSGDILHSAEVRDFTDIMFMIKNVCSYSSRHLQQKQAMQQITPFIKKITLTLLEEYLGQSNYDKFMQILPQEIDLFTFYHAPSVKAIFNEEFNDDIVVFERQEITNGIKMMHVKLPKPIQEQSQAPTDGITSNVKFVIDHPANPESTCYVLSPHHQAYKVSIYKGGGQERLLQFVKTMSHLSWLSVKPGHEYRTSSYPPHINALIQQNKSHCTSISQFEFLPTE